MFENDEAEVQTEGDVPEQVTEESSQEETPSEQPETAPGAKETPTLGDPNKLPPEVLPYYKEMQASFTKKMQSLQAAVDAVLPHKDTVELFNKAMRGDPDARATIARIAGSPEQKPVQAEDELPEQFESTKQLMDYIGKSVQKMIEKSLQGQIAPLQQQSQEIQMERMKAQADMEIESCRKQYPDFDDKIDSILAVRKKYPGLDLEASYKLATFQQKVPVQNTTMKPGTSPSKVAPKRKSAMTWEEAYEISKQELGMK